MYIQVICKSIKNVISMYDNCYGYRFGNNDYIITLPNWGSEKVEELSSKVEEEFNKNIDDLSFSIAELNKFAFEYNQQIDCVEDFYELLSNNASILGESKEATRRIIRHIIGTFTNNIRNTLASYKNANNLALKDDVSGLYNHRAGKLLLSGLINEYTKNQKGFAVMFIDGDNLKRYNKISYEAGNQMIRSLSQIITNCIRDNDKVFRWLSGDEFLVVSKEINKESALKLAERIRKAIEEHTKEFIYPTTVSIGIAHYPSDGSSIDEVINKAEKANSYAKDTGRNKSIMWDNIPKSKGLG